MPPVYLSDLPPDVSSGVAQSIKKLLSSKHLYQSLTISAETDFGASTKDQVRDLQHRLDFDEISFSAGQAIRASGASIYVQLLNIETHCKKCGDRKPFAPGTATSRPVHQPPISKFDSLPNACQILHLSFLCQSCQEEQVDFLVARKGTKLTISGRWPVEETPSPAFIPKDVRQYYSKATITFNAGFVLAALFYLRVVIEQYWRSLNLIDASQRATGDELGNLYKDRLPDAFNQNFPSLLDIYNQISGALHTANESKELFEESINKIEKHFDGRKHFDLGPAKP